MVDDWLDRVILSPDVGMAIDPIHKPSFWRNSLPGVSKEAKARFKRILSDSGYEDLTSVEDALDALRILDKSDSPEGRGAAAIVCAYCLMVRLDQYSLGLAIVNAFFQLRDNLILGDMGNGGLIPGLTMADMQLYLKEDEVLVPQGGTPEPRLWGDSPYQYNTYKKEFYVWAVMQVD